MLILIDGYNLLFGTNPSPEILKDDRESLIHVLVKMLTHTKLEATIIFDSYIPDTPETRGHLGPLEMIFTNKGELADELILKKIKSSTKPGQILLVTSDKRLAERAKRLLAKVVSTKEWFKQLSKLTLKGVKEKKQASLKEAPSPAIAPEKKIPKRSKDPENDSKFYQDVFEARYEAEKVEKAPLKAVKIEKKKKILKKIVKEPVVDEEERWLRLFEDRLKKL